MHTNSFQLRSVAKENNCDQSNQDNIQTEVAVRISDIRKSSQKLASVFKNKGN